MTSSAFFRGPFQPSPGPLPPDVGTCFSCSWRGHTSAQVMPRRARNMGRRPGRWPRSLGEGSSLSMGLLGAQLSSSLPKLDGAIHNLKESGWAARQKGEADSSIVGIQWILDTEKFLESPSEELMCPSALLIPVHSEV